MTIPRRPKKYFTIKGQLNVGDTMLVERWAVRQDYPLGQKGIQYVRRIEKVLKIQVLKEPYSIETGQYFYDSDAALGIGRCYRFRKLFEPELMLLKLEDNDQNSSVTQF